MPVMLDVLCTQCGEHTVPVPANAPGLAAVALCADCAAATHTIDHDEIREAQQASRKQAIEQAWATRTPAFFRAHDLVDDPAVVQRLTRAAANKAALIVYGPNTQRRSAIMWRYLAILGSTLGLPSPTVGGGEEANTLALATTADFKLIQSIKDDYLNRRYKAVHLDGIGDGRFLNESRRHEEYAALSRTMVANMQIPVFTTSLWSPNDPSANPFGAKGNPDLMKWVGVEAAVNFATCFDRNGRLALDA